MKLHYKLFFYAIAIYFTAELMRTSLWWGVALWAVMAIGLIDCLFVSIIGRNKFLANPIGYHVKGSFPGVGIVTSFNGTTVTLKLEDGTELRRNIKNIYPKFI